MGRTDACILCGTSIHNSAPERDGYRVCRTCDVTWCIVEGEVAPAREWDEDYYGRPELFTLHKARKSAMEGIVARLNALFPERGSLLDVGAGTGVLMQTAADAGWEVEGIEPATRAAEWARKLTNKPVHSGLLEEVCLPDQQYDVVWIDKGLTIRPATLSHIKAQSPKAMVVSYSADDMTNPGNQSAYWKQGLSAYDLVVTTKKHNIQDLQLMGARNVFYVDKSFDPHTHRPVQISRADKGAYGADVSFVGGFEPQRARSMQVLAENGYSIRVWGPTWDDRFRFGLDKLRIEGRPAYGDEYAKVVSASKINLCFLRKVNRDQQTARTMELPACGGFMLAERTSEHQRLFEEGQEAEFFGSDQELIDKVRFYLMSPEKRLAIAASGRQRCLNSGYSNHFRMDAISRKISELRVKE